MLVTDVPPIHLLKEARKNSILLNTCKTIPQILNILLMNFQDTVDYRNFPSFYPKDHDFSHSDWIFNLVREEQEISSVKGRLHASAAREKRSN